jgi:hypothetical protein
VIHDGRRDERPQLGHVAIAVLKNLDGAGHRPQIDRGLVVWTIANEVQKPLNAFERLSFSYRDANVTLGADTHGAAIRALGTRDDLFCKPSDTDQFVDTAGNIVLPDQTIERLQLVADVLAKNLMLSHYETRIASIFDRIEPLAATLRKQGRTGARSRELLQHIGNVLEMQHQMVGRVETGEKPELLWEHPELERLYMRLADEYELRDRDRALDRKLDIISRTVETLLGLVQACNSARVEWYIVLLIVAELVLAA